jgi:hypothetical protein
MTLRFAPDRIEQWPVERLAPSSRNPRTHSAEQVAQIAASIVEFGWSSPILAAGRPLAPRRASIALRRQHRPYFCRAGDGWRARGTRLHFAALRQPA